MTHSPVRPGATRRARAAGWSLAAVIVSAPSALIAQRGPAYPQWGALTAGRHAVGFRIDVVRDYSRRAAPLADFEGKRHSGPLELSLPVAVWYPAQPSPSSVPMPYGSVAAIGAQGGDYTAEAPENRRSAVEGRRSFAGFALGLPLADSLTVLIDTTRTAAVRDAPPAAGAFPVVLAATDGSIGVATVLFEYLASHGIVVIATPSRRADATLQVSRPSAVIEARVRDLEFLLDRARTYTFADTARLAVLGVNFDGMSALAFQMKTMAARAVVSLDGWEGKAGNVATVRAGLHYDPRRLRVPYLVVLQDEGESPPPFLRLDRSIFDDLQYAERQWLVLKGMSHGFLVGNPLAFPGLPANRRASYELLVRTMHELLARTFDSTARSSARDAGSIGGAEGARFVREAVHREAIPAIPDDAELERLIMVDRAVEKVERIFRDGRRRDSTFALFTEQTMALYAFRFARQNDRTTANRLLALNVAAYPASWNAASALGDGYLEAADTTRALEAYEHAIALRKHARVDTGALEERVAPLRAARRRPEMGVRFELHHFPAPRGKMM